VFRTSHPQFFIEPEVIIVCFVNDCQAAKAAIVGKQVVTERQCACAYQSGNLVPCVQGFNGEAVYDHIVEMSAGAFTQQYCPVLFRGAAIAVESNVVERGFGSRYGRVAGAIVVAFKSVVTLIAVLLDNGV
jgi:hypothetical protein